MIIYSPENSEDNIGILHHNKRISVSCDSISVVGNIYQCKYSLDYTNTGYYFCSNREDSNAWITYFFHDGNIAITNYSIKSPSFTGFDGKTYGAGPKSFKVEGTFGRETYLLDEVKESTLKDPGSVQTRPISRVDSYDSIKITMTDTNTIGQKEFRIDDFDIFGIFSPICQTIKKSININKYILVYIYFMLR